MAKFTCESEFLNESKKLYNKYIAGERQLKALIAETNANRDISQEAKTRDTMKMQEDIGAKRAGMKIKMDELEKEFSDWAYDFADLQGVGLSKTLGETVEQENIDKINDLTSEISDSLCKALDGVTEIQKIIDGSATELPEEIKAEQEKGHIFMHEVDCADAISHLQGATVTSMENIKFDGEDATEIIFKTNDGKNVELIHTMDALLCSGVYE